MIKFIIDAISQGLAFSKTEARGTFFLAILMILGITSFTLISKTIKKQEMEVSDSAELKRWVAEVKSSFSKKVERPQKPIYFEKKSTKPRAKPSKLRSFAEPKKSVEDKVVVLDLNTAKATELQKIKGIGKVYSERIIKYRELLGGFANSRQLLEVYGISEELASKIDERFVIESAPDPIKFNADSAKTLAKHPYISYDLAWVIINYRRQNGEIDSIEDLQQIKALSDSTLNKLIPYLK